MHRKITAQFLVFSFAVLTVAYLSFGFFTVLFFSRVRELIGPSGDLATQASEMTLDFEEYILWEEGQIHLAPAGLQTLRGNGLWIQVLDEDGNEIYQQFKPSGAPHHYTPIDLIVSYKYSGAIQDEASQRAYTIFVARAEREDRQLSYIIGFPDDEVIKTTLTTNPRAFFRDVALAGIGTLATITLLVAILGWLFGSWMAKPLAKIIDGIQHLARGRYSSAYPEYGIYREVHHSLNDLTHTLQANEAARKRLETVRDEWISNITHDIKTPLASIRGYAELLLEPSYSFSEEETRKYAGVIHSKSSYIEALLEDLRITYQLKNEAPPLEQKTENLVDILRESIINVLNDSRQSEPELQFDPQAETIAFACDGKLIQRAFTNLIYNAVVHNPPGVEIHVSIWVDSTIHVVIEDRGQGIPPEDLENLFERYYRGTNTGQAHKGSGLGMAIARQIIAAHSGTIHVTSQPGEGTRIAINFPPQS